MGDVGSNRRYQYSQSRGDSITVFEENENEILSNSYPCNLRIWDHNFKSAEHAYQFKKIDCFKNDELSDLARSCGSFTELIDIGKQFTDDMEPWRKFREEIMWDIICTKAIKVPEFRTALLMSKETIAKADSAETFWSTGFGKEKSEFIPATQWEGKNKMGRLLVQLRDKLLKEGCCITVFQGEKDVLSNFYPCQIQLWETQFSSSEHAYQFKKAETLGNTYVANSILCSPSARQAKQLSKQLGRGKPAWDDIKLNMMREIIRAKVHCVREYKDALLCANDIITEAVDKDRVWASGLNKEDSLATPPYLWPGKNIMGKLHMELRAELLGSRSPAFDFSFENKKIPQRRGMHESSKESRWQETRQDRKVDSTPTSGYMPNRDLREKISRSRGHIHSSGYSVERPKEWLEGKSETSTKEMKGERSRYDRYDSRESSERRSKPKRYQEEHRESERKILPSHSAGNANSSQESESELQNKNEKEFSHKRHVQAGESQKRKQNSDEKELKVGKKIKLDRNFERLSSDVSDSGNNHGNSDRKKLKDKQDERSRSEKKTSTKKKKDYDRKSSDRESADERKWKRKKDDRSSPESECSKDSTSNISKNKKRNQSHDLEEDTKNLNLSLPLKYPVHVDSDQEKNVTENENEEEHQVMKSKSKGKKRRRKKGGKRENRRKSDDKEETPLFDVMWNSPIDTNQENVPEVISKGDGERCHPSIEGTPERDYQEGGGTLRKDEESTEFGKNDSNEDVHPQSHNVSTVDKDNVKDPSVELFPKKKKKKKKRRTSRDTDDLSLTKQIDSDQESELKPEREHSGKKKHHLKEQVLKKKMKKKRRKSRDSVDSTKSEPKELIKRLNSDEESVSELTSKVTIQGHSKGRVSKMKKYKSRRKSRESQDSLKVDENGSKMNIDSDQESLNELKSSKDKEHVRSIKTVSKMPNKKHGEQSRETESNMFDVKDSNSEVDSGKDGALRLKLESMINEKSLPVEPVSKLKKKEQKISSGSDKSTPSAAKDSNKQKDSDQETEAEAESKGKERVFSMKMSSERKMRNYRNKSKDREESPSSLTERVHSESISNLSYEDRKVKGEGFIEKEVAPRKRKVKPEDKTDEPIKHKKIKLNR